MKKPEKYGNTHFYKPPKPKEKEGDWGPVHTFIVLAFFAGLALMVVFSLRTLISIIDLSKILAACLFSGMLIPKKYYRKWFAFNIYEVILFNLLGIGPLLCGLILTLNFAIPRNTYSESRKIIAKKITTNIGGSKVLFHLENGAYKEFTRIRKFDLNDFEKVKKAQYIIYTFSDGLLGLKVMRDWELE